MRIDWPGLLDDLAWAIARRKWGRQRAVLLAMRAAGFSISATQLRSWFRGRARPRDPDIAAWLIDAAHRRSVPIRRKPDDSVSCETPTGRSDVDSREGGADGCASA